MRKIYIGVLLLITTLASVSCADWLDIEPDGQATNDKLTETGDGYRTMISGVYKAMTSANLYGRELQFGIIDCMSQQYSWRWYSSFGQQTSKTIYQQAAELNYYDTNLRDNIDAIWKDAYNVIANANNLIQTISNETPAKFAYGEMERDMILGEAYACRALMHFDLCRLFAPAPVENETGKYIPYVDSYPNIQPEGIEVSKFLDKVVEDLNKGLELTAKFDTTSLGMSLNSSYNSRFYGTFDYSMEGYDDPAGVDDFFKGRGYRLNYYAINAILARVHQYRGEYKLAYDYAQKVMDFKAYGYNGTTMEMFTADDWSPIANQNISNDNKQDVKISSNMIFALYNSESYEDYNIESYFKKQSDQPAGNVNWLLVDLQGQEIFKNRKGEDESELDYRAKYQLFVPDFANLADGNYKATMKWYCSEYEATRTKNMQLLPIIRATEMRYIIAEYYAREGKYDDAYNVLNQVREKRTDWYGGMSPLEVQNSLDAFLDDMVRDAQREWISEGQLFYLYKRLGYNKVKIGNETRKFNKAEYMLPIPNNQNM